MVKAITDITAKNHLVWEKDSVFMEITRLAARKMIVLLLQYANIKN